MAKRGPKPKKEIVWSAELAYAVGLMATDGNLSPDERHLELTSKDLEQVQNIKNVFNVNAEISTKGGGTYGKGKEYFRIQWGDVTLYKFLLEAGLTPRKSFTLGALKIPDEYFFHFLRGCYDGDGSFYSYFDPRWKSSFMFYFTFLSASYEHILWLQETIQRLSGLSGHITRTGKRCLMSNLKYAKKETLILLNYIYPASSVLCLERKRLKIVDALRIVGITLPNLVNPASLDGVK
jgi:hypothetical protein